MSRRAGDAHEPHDPKYPICRREPRANTGFDCTVKGDSDRFFRGITAHLCGGQPALLQPDRIVAGRGRVKSDTPLPATARKIIDFELEGTTFHREPRIFDGVHPILISLLLPLPSHRPLNSSPLTIH